MALRRRLNSRRPASIIHAPFFTGRLGLAKDVYENDSDTHPLSSWAALVVVAGYGYYHVKSNNTAKKRDFMIKQGRSQQEQQQQLHNGELAEGQASPMPAREWSEAITTGIQSEY